MLDVNWQNRGYTDQTPPLERNLPMQGSADTSLSSALSGNPQMQTCAASSGNLFDSQNASQQQNSNFLGALIEYLSAGLGKTDRTQKTDGTEVKDRNKRRKKKNQKQGKKQDVSGFKAYQQAFLDKINAFRRSHGKKEVKLDPKLCDAAKKHAQWMTSSGRFSHTGRGGSSFVGRERQSGYKGSATMENIAMGTKSTSEAMRMWINSPGHRVNLLSGNTTRIGIACVNGRWVLDGGRGGESLA